MSSTYNYLGIEIHRKNPDYVSDFSKTLLDGFYTREGESIPQALARPATAFCFGDYALAQRIYTYAYEGFFMYASPVLSNAPAGEWKADPEKDGANYWYKHSFIPHEKLKGLPISCFAFVLPDNLDGQVQTIQELAALSTSGGGTGAHNMIRATSKKAPGPIPYNKVLDSTIGYFRQGGVRRGALAVYMDVDHPDIAEHIRFRVPGGDSKRRSDNRTQFHNAVNLTDTFIAAVLAGGDYDLVCPHSHKVHDTISARGVWEDILDTRALTGEPYMMKIDLANRRMPEVQKRAGLRVRGSNLCLAASTRVATKEHGLIEIVKLAESGETFHILNGDKEWAPATAFKSGRKKLLRMILKNGQFAELSEDHVVEERQVFGEKSRDHRYAETPAGQMLGKRVVPFLGTGDWEGSEPFTETMATFLGLVQGDGTFVRYKKPSEDAPEQAIESIHIKAPSEPEFTDFLKSNAKILGYEYTEDSSGVIRIPYKYVKDVFESLGFCTKTLPYRVAPTEAFRLSPKLMRAFLRGVFSANGCAMPAHTRIALTTTCQGLAEDLQQMLIALGLNAYITEGAGQTIDWSNGTYTSLPNFIVAIGSAWGYNKFQEEIGFIHKHKTCVPVVEDSRTVNSVRSTEVESLVDIGEHDVYDFTENKTHWGWLNGMKLHNCSEITLPTNDERSFVCCLSSLNLERYDEWKDTTIVQDIIRFLDNVLEFFLLNAPDVLKKAKYSAERERALGLGTLGWHSLLQKKGIPFEGGGFGSSVQLTHEVYSLISSRAKAESQQLALERGEAPDMVGTGMRNSRLMAVAPNSNSADIANTSPSIEPWYRNVFVKDTRAGSFVVKNKYLEELLESLGLNTKPVWDSIRDNAGSVAHLSQLTERQKAVFKTALEIDQHWVIELADHRGQYVDQAQSLNTFFPAGASRAYVNSVHLKFLRSDNVVTLYYYRTEKTTSVDMVKSIERKALADWSPAEGAECVACQG
jgi:ribonucleotide reductase alpha subunit